MLPVLALAQNSSIPGMGGFNLPPRPTPTPAPPPSGPIVAPFARPTPALAPAPTPAPSAVVPPPVATTTGSPATARPTPRPGATQPAPAATAIATGTPQPTASATPAAAPSAAVASPVAQPTGTTIPVTIVPQSGWSTGTLVALGAGALALFAGGFFLLRRRRRPELVEESALELTEVAPPPAPPPPPPSPHLTVPLRPRTVTGAVAEPEVEIVLIPRRAGTNLMSAAVDYRILVRNNGKGDARDVRFGIYLFSASARQAADLQMIFAAKVEQPVVAPFTLVPGQEVELSGMAQLQRDNVNVMTIDGKPWFVPVMAMKAEYRWGENVGVAAIATAAHMIGIDRGEGAKMQPFRFDGSPMMHPEVAERKVA